MRARNLVHQLLDAWKLVMFNFISHRKRLDKDHVAGHDVAGLLLLFDSRDKFVFNFWSLTLFSPVAALALRHALELFNLLMPITN